MKVLGELRAQRQVAGVEPLDLLHRGPGVLGEVEDVDLPLGEDDPHADRRVPQLVDRVPHAGEGIRLQPCPLQGGVELPLDDPRGRRPVRIVGEEQEVRGMMVRIALAGVSLELQSFRSAAGIDLKLRGFRATDESVSLCESNLRDLVTTTCEAQMVQRNRQGGPADLSRPFTPRLGANNDVEVQNAGALDHISRALSVIDHNLELLTARSIQQTEMLRRIVQTISSK